jgi:branched-chain amino acid transport system permease protein
VSTSVIIDQAIAVLANGGMYALMAVGVTFLFGLLNLINFAHGEVLVVGAFAVVGLLLLCPAFQVALPGWLVLCLFLATGTLVAAGAGLLLERLAIRPLLGQEPSRMLVATMGTGVCVRELIMQWWPNGASPQPVPDPVPLLVGKGLWGYPVPLSQILAVAATFVVVVAVGAWVARTTYGRWMRAVAEDFEAAILVGIPARRVVTLGVLIGCGLAGLAGVFEGVVYGSVRYDMGLPLMIKGFAAAVVGGLTSLRGAAAGAYLLALLEGAVELLVPGGRTYRDLAACAVLLIGLAIAASKGYGATQQERP